MFFGIYGRKSVYSDKSDSVDNQHRMCNDYIKAHFKADDITCDIIFRRRLHGSQHKTPRFTETT
mgnify:CR=1 FL=1